jgi:Na+-driven multidrug efflux pump
VMTEQTFNTIIRTTDIFITAAFAPAAIAAIGLANLYTRLPLRIGLGLGSGAIALWSGHRERRQARSKRGDYAGAARRFSRRHPVRPVRTLLC